MGETFPFEVGLISHGEAKKDKDLLSIRSSDIPECINVFVEKSILKDLEFYDEKYPLIIDYIELGNISQIFIPMIPLPLDEYDFFGE